MTTWITFLCGIVSFLTVIFATNHIVKISFAVVGIISFGIAYLARRQSEKNGTVSSGTHRPGKLHITAEHQAILNQFRIHDGEQLSADDVQRLTNIEPIKVHLIIFDLVSHGILQRTNQDGLEGGVRYLLSEHGGKFMRKSS
jgi:hypothetical protein